MKVAEILGVNKVRFIESAFAALTDSRFTTMLAETRADEGRLLLDEQEEPVAIAFHGADGWIAGSFLCRNPSVALIDHFEEVNGEIFQENRDIWAGAVREYFSDTLAAVTPPGIEDLNPTRRGILTALIAGTWGRSSGEPCFDCCCGSGVGSLVLRDLGFAPLSYDNDAALISRGLVEGRLRPDETMYLDATIASRYVDPVSRGIAIMMGEINSYSQEMWEQIVQELFTLSQDTLITVGTEKEAILIKGWGTAMGKDVEVSENPADPIYDRWVCRARPH